MKLMTLTGAVIVLLGSAALNAHAGQPSAYYTAPEAQDTDGFREVLVKVAPHIYMSGQPSPEGLTRLKEAGVTRVVNLRTSMEMDNRDIVSFDEAALIEELGMDYVHIPSGGPDTPYSPATVQQLAESLADAEGDVLLHCTVAWRATHLWTAYLIRHQNVPVDEAIDIARKLNLGTLPLEGFLGEPITIGIADE